MTTRPAGLKRRIEAFLLEVLLWISVIYAFDRVLSGSQFQSGAWLGFIVVIGLNLFLMTRATTLGKYILDLKIVDTNSGMDLSFRRMLLRETVGKFVSAAIFLIGFIWIIIDNDNAGWHDKMCRSRVVEVIRHKEKTMRNPDDDEFFVRG